MALAKIWLQLRPSVLLAALLLTLFERMARKQSASWAEFTQAEVDAQSGANHTASLLWPGYGLLQKRRAGWYR